MGRSEPLRKELSLRKQTHPRPSASPPFLAHLSLLWTDTDPATEHRLAADSSTPQTPGHYSTGTGTTCGWVGGSCVVSADLVTLTDRKERQLLSSMFAVPCTWAASSSKLRWTDSCVYLQSQLPLMLLPVSFLHKPPALFLQSCDIAFIGTRICANSAFVYWGFYFVFDFLRQGLLWTDVLSNWRGAEAGLEPLILLPLPPKF